MAQQPQRREKRPLFDQSYYLDIAHEMDPEQEIAPEAIDYLNEIAWCFFIDIRSTLLGLKKSNDHDARGAPRLEDRITEADVRYVLQTKYKLSLPGATGPIITDQIFQNPTAEYQEKLRAVRTFAANQGDD